MKILVVSATAIEAEAFRTEFGIPNAKTGEAASISLGKHSISLLATGIGMVNTAYHLGRYFLTHSPELAIQFGIGGAFPEGPEMGEAVEMKTEIYGDLGAETPNGFLDLEEMGFANVELNGRRIYNELSNPEPSRAGLRQCRGLTVNRVHGALPSIEMAREKWKPEVESMEGAAFFQACLMNKVPFASYRGISNRVEPRNREAWDIPAAISAVTRVVVDQIRTLTQHA